MEDLMPKRRWFVFAMIALLVCSAGVLRAKDDDEGWTRIGKVELDDQVKEKDVVASVLRGGWRFLKLKVIDADAKIEDVTVIYSGGRDADLKVKDEIKADHESRPISLKANDHPVKKIKIKGKSGESGKHTVVEVWMKDKD
jgi:hypothetical protein